jgi:hypothetical protein
VTLPEALRSSHQPQELLGSPATTQRLSPHPLASRWSQAPLHPPDCTPLTLHVHLIDSRYIPVSERGREYPLPSNRACDLQGKSKESTAKHRDDDAKEPRPTAADAASAKGARRSMRAEDAAGKAMAPLVPSRETYLKREMAPARAREDAEPRLTPAERRSQERDREKVSCLGADESSLGGAESSLGAATSSLGGAESSLGGAESSLGDAESSLGGAESSLGDDKSSLGDAESSLGDDKSSLGDDKSSLGDAESSLGDDKSSLGDAES